MVTLAAGTVLAMWIGELITERGIGNGISFIIFAGIVARVPQGVATYLSNPDIAGGVAFVILAIVVVAVIVYIQEGQRRIPIQYASRVRGRRMYQGGATFLPLRVNQAGVIPIIFAVSILLFPTQIASYFATPPGAPSLVDRQPDRRRHRQLPETQRPGVHRLLLPVNHGLGQPAPSMPRVDAGDRGRARSDQQTGSPAADVQQRRRFCGQGDVGAGCTSCLCLSVLTNHMAGHVQR